MRLHFLLPAVKPAALAPPTACPTPDCPGTVFRFHQAVRKPLRDTRYPQVAAHRYQCLHCHHTFRVYPPGVTRASTSQRVRGLGVMLYLLGLSYGATALTLEALGAPLSKTQVYAAVQAAAAAVPGLRRERLCDGVRTPALGADLTSVRCRGQWLTLGLVVAAVQGTVLTIDALPDGEAATLQEWLGPIAAAVGAEILVTDDADGFKTVADGAGLAHQVCKAHVVRNTDQLIASLSEAVVGDPDGSLAALGVTPEEAQADLARLGELCPSRQPREEADVGALHARYQGAAPPARGQKWSLAYRLRQLMLDRWELWRRLTRYRHWQGPGEERLDGTNNTSERAIGWWVKERYRAMRGYKVPENAVNVSRLLAWAGNQLEGRGAALAEVLG